MTLDKFKQMDVVARIEAFWHGAMVKKYSKKQYSYECRQVHDFYVVYRTDGAKMLEMSCYKNLRQLNTYLHHTGN